MRSEEEYGAVLLRPLSQDPPAPSTVDITRAITEGRRRRRARRLSGYAAAATVTVIAMASLPTARGLLSQNATPAPGTAPTGTAPAPTGPAPSGEPSTG